MSDDLARRTHAIFVQALDVDAPERDAFVAEKCAGDPTLAGRVRKLIAALDRSSGFLETPALKTRVPDAETHDGAPPAIRVRGYRVLRTIGAGGMATVYEALQEQPERTVALKVMNRALANTSAVRRFRYETDALARLQHPGIAQIFEAGTCDDGHGHALPFFAMEFIAGARPIDEHAESLSLRDKLTMFAGVCDAVHHGHQIGIIHRDLKPANILVDASGRTKIIDFGVARSTDADHPGLTRRTDVGQLIGTLNFMSPEQCAGAADIDVRTDVYSLGVILFQLIAGRLPHDLARVSIPEAVRIITQDAPARLASLAPHARGDLEAIVLKAIEKDPARRYNGAAALAADIRRWLNHQTIDARPPTTIHQARLFARRHRVLVGAGAALALTLVTASIFVTIFALRADAESRRRHKAELVARAEAAVALRQSYIANIAGAFGALRAGEFQQLRARIAAAPPEHRGWEWHYLAAMAERSERTIPAHHDMIYTSALSADGARLVTGSRDGGIAVWDTSSGAPIARTDGIPETPVFAVAFSPDATHVVSGAEDGVVRIWDAQTMTTVRQLDAFHAAVTSVSWSCEGLIAAAAGKTARLWDARSGTLRHVLTDQENITRLSFAQDGSSLLTAGNDGDIWLRSPDGHRVLQRWSFGARPECAVVSDDGSLVAVGGSNGRVVVWNARSGDLVRELPAQDISTVRAIDFSHHAERLAASQVRRGIVIWSLPEDRAIGQFHGHEEAISGVFFSPDDSTLFSTSWDRSFRVWDLSSAAMPQAITSLTGHESQVIGVDFSPDGAILASCGRDWTVRLWDPELGIPLGVLRGHTGHVFDVAFSPDGRRIASGGLDRTVRVWNATTGVSSEPIDAVSQIWAVAFSPDGRCIGAAGEDGVVRVFDSVTRAPIYQLPPHSQRVIDIAFSPDGGMLASCSRDGAVRLWDASTGRLLHDLDKHDADAFAVIFSHDSRTLFSGSRDQSVRVFDARSGTLRETLAGHGQFITSLSLSPDGARLAAGAWFGEIILWDASTLELVGMFRAHENTIRAVAFDPRGKWLASCSYDRTIRIADASPSGERRARRQQAQANYAAAQQMVDRLARTCDTAEELMTAVQGEAPTNPGVCAWARKIVLMRELQASNKLSQ